MEVDTITGLTDTGNARINASSPSAALGSDDFFQLLITQLTQQDPLEPTSNEELLQQISSIREIELSSAITESLQALSNNREVGSLSNLIGQFVEGGNGESFTRGLVERIDFDESGKPMLVLSNGAHINVESITSVMAASSAAQGMMGQLVSGISESEDGTTELAEGIVTGTRTAEDGRLFLELDTGESVRLDRVLSASTPNQLTAGVA